MGAFMMSASPAIVQWENEEHTIIRFTLRQRWMWSDVRAAKEQIDSMMGTVDHKVNLIVSNEHTNWMPGNFNQNVLDIIDNLHPNMGLLVVVSNNALFEQLFRLFVTLNGGVPFEFVFVQSLEAARATLLAASAA
jgi:hypothetical protein